MANIIEYTTAKVDVISGGHIVLGQDVTSIGSIKRVDFGPGVDITVKEYELPTRIDFQSPTPPVVGSAAPGSISAAELHVPAGALDTYLNHPQWGKAAYFVDGEGKVVDNYAAKHKARKKKLKKELEEAAEKAAERAKQEKLNTLGGMTHPILAKQHLAKWQYTENVWTNKTDFVITISPLKVKISVPNSAPMDVWDSIVSHLEDIEVKMKDL